MYKKIIMTALLLLSESFMDASLRNKPPYESIIAHEYNRIRAGIDWYTSIDSIINRTSRGISVEQRNKNIADLQALRVGIETAIQQANNDGKGVWYYAYLYKDTQNAMETLYEYLYDVNNRLAEYAKQNQSDLETFARYIAPYVIGAVTGITALYLSQDYYLKEGESGHGLFEMHAAPIAGTLYAGKYLATQGLLATSAISGGIKSVSDYLVGTKP